MHKHSSKGFVFFLVVRELVDKEKELGTKEVNAKNSKNFHSREKKPRTSLDDSQHHMERKLGNFSCLE